LYQEELVSSKISKAATRRRVGELLGINPAMLRNWIERENKASSATAATFKPDRYSLLGGTIALVSSVDNLTPCQ
jgi:hypothetical protein